MHFKKLCLSVMIGAVSLSASALDVKKPQILDRAQVKQINMVAQDKHGHDIEFDVSARCGAGYQGIGKIIMSDSAAKDEAMLLKFKYGPQVAKQFMNHWNTKASDNAPRLPTVAMFIYPENGHELASLLTDSKNRQQKLASLNSNESMKVMVAQDSSNTANSNGEIIVFACGGKEHPPKVLR